jgi:hypothetical protein
MPLIRRVSGRPVREEVFRTKLGKQIQQEMYALAGDFDVTVEDARHDLRQLARVANEVATSLVESTDGKLKLKLPGNRSGIRLVDE